MIPKGYTKWQQGADEHRKDPDGPKSFVFPLRKFVENEIRGHETRNDQTNRGEVKAMLKDDLQGNYCRFDKILKYF